MTYGNGYGIGKLIFCRPPFQNENEELVRSNSGINVRCILSFSLAIEGGGETDQFLFIIIRILFCLLLSMIPDVGRQVSYVCTRGLCILIRGCVSNVHNSQATCDLYFLSVEYVSPSSPIRKSFAAIFFFFFFIFYLHTRNGKSFFWFGFGAA